MLSEVLEVAFDLADSCAACSGEEPSWPTYPGSLGGGGGGGTPTFEPQQSPPTEKPEDGPRDERSERDRSDRDRSERSRSDKGYEKQLQRQNAQDTIVDLVWEVVTSPAGAIGKVLGPLAPVAAGAEPLAEGYATFKDADIYREDQTYRESGGALGKPAPEGFAENNRLDTGSDSGSTRQPGQRETPRQPDKSAMSEQEAAAQEHYERTMENIRIKEQMRQAGTLGDDSWKNWR